MLPEGYVLHDDVMASLPPERLEKIRAKSRRLLAEAERQELREKERLAAKQATRPAEPPVNRPESWSPRCIGSASIRK